MDDFAIGDSSGERQIVPASGARQDPSAENEALLAEGRSDPLPHPALGTLNLTPEQEAELRKTFDREIHRIKRGLHRQLLLLRAQMFLSQLRAFAMHPLFYLRLLGLQMLLQIIHIMPARLVVTLAKPFNRPSALGGETDVD